MSVFYAVMLLVIAERLSELFIARRNTRRLLEKGGIEYGAGHYPAIVLLHAGWLVALLVLVPHGRPPNWWFLGPFLAIQPLRYWIIATLGERWTTRVIVLPGVAPVQTGPYRFIRHPNYCIVALEILLLPLAFDAWLVGLVFTIANAAVLKHRISVEEMAIMGAGSQNLEQS